MNDLKWLKLTEQTRPPEDEEVLCKGESGVVIGVVWMQSNGRFHCVGNQLSTVVTHWIPLTDLLALPES